MGYLWCYIVISMIRMISMISMMQSMISNAGLLYQSTGQNYCSYCSAVNTTRPRAPVVILEDATRR